MYLNLRVIIMTLTFGEKSLYSFSYGRCLYTLTHPIYVCTCSSIYHTLLKHVLTHNYFFPVLCRKTGCIVCYDVPYGMNGEGGLGYKKQPRPIL